MAHPSKRLGINEFYFTNVVPISRWIEIRILDLLVIYAHLFYTNKSNEISLQLHFDLSHYLV